MARSSTADDRIDLRVNSDDKALIAKAAAIELTDVKGFILRTVLPEARAVIEKSERIKLSARDTDFVLDLLENPPEPTPALIRALKAIQDKP